MDNLSNILLILILFFSSLIGIYLVFRLIFFSYFKTKNDFNNNLPEQPKQQEKHHGSKEK